MRLAWPSGVVGRVIGLTALGLWVSMAAAAAQEPAPQQAAPQPTTADEDREVTRYGDVVLTRTTTGTDSNWRVSHNDRTLIETEFDELELVKVVRGKDRDYVIVERASGGIACPYYYRVVEVVAEAASIVSDEFGSCLQPRKTRLYGDALVVEMPAYTPHPELLTLQEIRERKLTTAVFTVRRGRVTEREEIRR